MKIKAIQCPNCKDVIFSRTRHDYRSCGCDAIGIDGGFDYFKMSFKGKVPKELEINVDATRQELFNDWNNGNDKFGIINKQDKE